MRYTPSLTHHPRPASHGTHRGGTGSPIRPIHLIAYGKEVHAYGKTAGRVEVGIGVKGAGAAGAWRPFMVYHCTVGKLRTIPIRFSYLIARDGSKELKNDLDPKIIPDMVLAANRALYQTGTQLELDKGATANFPATTLAKNTVTNSKTIYLEDPKVFVNGLPITIVEGKRVHNNFIYVIRNKTTGETILRNKVPGRPFTKAAKVKVNLTAKKIGNGIWEIRGVPKNYVVEAAKAYGCYGPILNPPPASGISVSMVKHEDPNDFFGGGDAIGYSSSQLKSSLLKDNAASYEAEAENGVEYDMLTLKKTIRYNRPNVGAVTMFDASWNKRVTPPVLRPIKQIKDPVLSGFTIAHEVLHCGRIKHRKKKANNSDTHSDDLVMLGEIPVVRVVPPPGIPVGDNPENMMFTNPKDKRLDVDLLQSEVFRSMVLP